MQRVIEYDQLPTSVRDAWTVTWSPKTSKQASLDRERNKRLSRVMKELKIVEGTDTV